MQVFISTIIAILLAYVAWQNYKINSASFYLEKNKLRFNLFDKRLQVFEACQKFFSSVMREGVAKQEEYLDFVKNTSEAEFLFRKKLREYISTVKEKACRSMEISMRLEDRNLPTGEERSLLAEEKKELLLWFGRQREESKKVFRKYLQISIDKNPF